MVKLLTVPGARPVNEGEALVIQYLRANLPETYTLIPNFELPAQGHPPYEYDAVIIAPHAVYVIEIKRWLGGIRGDAHTWYVGGAPPRPSPVPNANNKARILKSLLERRVPGGKSVWVEAIVVIADDACKLEITGSAHTRVFLYTQVVDFLRNPNELGNKAGNIREHRKKIEHAILEAAHGRQTGPLRFGDYEVLQTLVQRDAFTEYRARNVTLGGNREFRLRVFSYDPYLPEDQLVRRREIMRREALALSQIAVHPNLISMRSSFTDPNDPNLFVVVTDWSGDNTLRTLMNSPLPLEQALELSIGIVQGLKAAHDAGVIHRDVRPEHILISPDGHPQLTNFDYARLSLPNTITLSPISRDPDVPHIYLAPELAANLRPTPAADLYAVGVMLYEMLDGQPIYEHLEESSDITLSNMRLQELGGDVPDALINLIQLLVQADPQRRPQNADEVLQVLIAVNAPSTSEIQQPVEAVRFFEGDIIDNSYKVLRVLNTGASGQVYEVYDEIADDTYALKVFNDTSFSRQSIEREIRALRAIDRLKSPHIIQVYHHGRLPSGRYYMVMELVKGVDLKHYTTPEPPHLTTRESVRIIMDLLAALETIHPNSERIGQLLQSPDMFQEEYEELQRLRSEGWIHRDIKPGNLMLGSEGVKLVDFNIAVRASDAGQTYIGTTDYMLPGVGINRWRENADLFAAGIVLYELITGQHPYPDRQPNLDDLPTDPRAYVPTLSPRFATLLQRAVSCDPASHYHSAHHFRQDLEALDEVYHQPAVPLSLSSELDIDDWEIDKQNYNPYVTRFLRLYSQAFRDNSGTRGLDRVAQMTYVQTRLDTDLAPQVLTGRYRLVIITGNAGDGKTAFVQRLEAAVEASNVNLTRITNNSSSFAYHGYDFLTNYDGSQDEGENRANNQVLAEFFAPFADTFFARVDEQPIVYIIAINQGRLLDFFSTENEAAAPFNQLTSVINSFFENSTEKMPLPDWFLLVDLNQRSVVAVDPETNLSIFESQLNQFLKPEFWKACQGCAHHNRCFIKFNIDTLADPASGAEVRRRISLLFEIIHLRRQLHITMRDLRSALSWMLFRDHDCDEVQQILTSSVEESLETLYYNAFAFDGLPPEGRTDDRLVSLLRPIDPAQMANPALDRTLYYQRLDGVAPLSFENRTSGPHPVTDWLNEWDTESSRDHNQVLRQQKISQMLRRVVFFEQRDAGWMAMLPYQQLDLFRQVTQRREQHEELKSLIARGISLIEGAGRQNEMGPASVFIRAGGQPKTPIKSFRVFPLQDFAIDVPQAPAGEFAEYTPDVFIFYFDHPDETQQNGNRPELLVSLDLLELFSQTDKGFAPSADDVRGVFVNFTVFRNTLMHLPYKYVRLRHENGNDYELWHQSNSKIVLRKLVQDDEA